MKTRHARNIFFSVVFYWTLFLIAAPSIADLVTTEEMTKPMKTCVTALENDGINSTMYKKKVYTCWHIARDVQKGLGQTGTQDTALVKIKFKEREGDEVKVKDHWVLDAGWKIGEHDVFIEPGTGKLYKGTLNLMQHYRRGKGITEATPEVERHSRLRVVVDFTPLSVSLNTEITITVTVYDRTDGKGLYDGGRPVPNQPLTVWLTPPNGTKTQISAAGDRTDAKGKWTKKMIPCPGSTLECLGDFRIDAEVPTSPVAGKGLDEGKCIFRIGMVPLLDPGTAYCAIGSAHQLTVTLVCAESGAPKPNEQVRFTVLEGPHAGTSGVVMTDANGQAVWSYTGIEPGMDTIVAEPTDSYTLSHVDRKLSVNDPYAEISRQVYVTWVEEDNPTLPPSEGYGWQDILLDDFEGDFPGNWEIREKETSPIANWGKDSYQPHGGLYSVFCAKDGPDGVDPPQNYPDDMASAIVFGPFDLRDADFAELNFYYWLKSADSNDRFWYLASLDGTHFYGQYKSGDSEGWQYQSFKLDDVFGLEDLSGQPSVWIAFYFVSDSSGSDAGAFVDNVELKKWIPNFPVVPDIRANGSDYPIVIPVGDNVVISLGMDAGLHTGESADWFLVAIDPGGSITSYYQGPLFSFDDTAIVNFTDLEVGDHSFYFGIDLEPNGAVDLDSLFYDGVQVKISQP